MIRFIIIIICSIYFTFGQNVGIGEPLPTEKLHINGNLRLQGAFMPDNLPGASGDVLISQGANTPPIWQTPGKGNSTIGLCGAATNNYLIKYDAISDALCQSIIYDDGTRAGIGTTTPTALWHLSLPTGFTDDMFLVNASSYSTVIDNYGHVGIGILTPAVLLEVIGIGGNSATVNSTADLVAMVDDNHWVLNAYATGTANHGAIYARTEGNTKNSTTTNNKPTIEIDNYGSGQGLLISTYNTAIDTAYPIMAQNLGDAKYTAYFTNWRNTNQTSVVYAVYLGNGNSGNAAVFGRATDAGAGNGTGIKGVGGWTGIYGYEQTGVSSWAGYFSGNVKITGDLTVVGNISKGGGTFKIDHPLDPENKYLYHSFVESPDMMNIYSGRITTDNNGIAKVKLPDYFNALNKNIQYQLTPIGKFANAIILKEINSNNEFVIKTDKPNTTVCWLITGVRKDPYANKYRIIPEVEKEPENKGKYLHPEVYGKPENLRIGYEKEMKEIGEDKFKHYPVQGK